MLLESGAFNAPTATAKGCLASGTLANSKNAEHYQLALLAFLAQRWSRCSMSRRSSTCLHHLTWQTCLVNSSLPHTQAAACKAALQSSNDEPLFSQVSDRIRSKRKNDAWLTLAKHADKSWVRGPDRSLKQQGWRNGLGEPKKTDADADAPSRNTQPLPQLLLSLAVPT